MFKALVDRPILSLCTTRRNLHISRTCLSESLAGNSSAKATKRGRRAAPKEPLRAPTPIADRVLLPEHNILKNVREVESVQDITLEDVECRRPKSIPPGSEDPERYAKAYRRLAADICRSFNKQQLKQILTRLYGVSLPSDVHDVKEEYARHLLKEWSWQSPEEIAQRDSFQTRTLNVKPSEIYHVMNDPSVLRRMKRSRIQIQPDYQTNTLQLVGRGHFIDTFLPVIQQLQKDIREETVAIPVTVKFTDAQLEDISQLAGAFVERLGDSSFRVSYHQRKPDALAIAQQAIFKTGYSNAVSANKNIFCYEAAKPDGGPYALTPFVPMQSLVSGKSDAITYRLSKGQADLLSKSTLSSGSDVQSTIVDLRTWLQQMSEASGSSDYIIDSIPGYQLLQVADGSSHPLAIEECALYDGLDKIKRGLPDRLAFYPSLPKPVVGVPDELNQNCQRFEYRAVPSSPTSSADPDVTPVIRFYITVGDPTGSLIARRYPNLVPSTTPESNEKPTTFRGLCSQGWTKRVDLLLPDSTVDLQFLVNSLSPQTIPPALQEYLDKLNAQYANQDPDRIDAPHFFHQGGQLYILKSTAFVRMGLKVVPEILGDLFTEVTSDIESKESESICYVTSRVDNTKESWEEFLQKSSGLLQLARVVPEAPKEDSMFAL